VLSSFARGAVVEKTFDAVEELARHGRGLHRSEKALLALLEPRAAPGAPARAPAQRPGRSPQGRAAAAAAR
jgi:hypothetical protein